ncbi:Arylsulfatase [Hondaea fermentalgiana]|uniref:Arylsulfatase n=1 Tax=Hondaea fermentalgiana TaxID=2315210 RepID=A0A2R5G3J3_9STRA|nr:Arylsulfatase [Hondaea fermentalgiana]|eukprot:GBG25607.1 Arylsulfatase [Hondaea fermentalgiana]
MRQNLAAALGCVLAVVASGPRGAEANKPKNVVFYLTDDLGVGMINQHAPDWTVFENTTSFENYAESRRIRTPTLEKLAREGKRMLHSYVSSSVCAPSRHSLITGVQTGVAEIRGNGFGPDGNTDADLDPNRTTIGEVLSAAGFRTGAVGKWGVATNETSSGSPCKRGFDSFYGKFTHKSMGAAFPTTMLSCSSDDPDNVTTHEFPENEDSSASLCVVDNETETPSSCSHFDVLTREAALSFVREYENDSTPFFLYWATYAGHSALYSSENKFENCEDKTYPVTSYGRFTKSAVAETGRATSTIRGLMATTEYLLDEDLRQLLATLEDVGADENTMIIFATDNGPGNGAFMDPDIDVNRDFNGAGGLVGIKRRMREGGIRSPTIVWYPNKVPAGTTSHYPIMHYDWALTIAGAVGIPSSSPTLDLLKSDGAGGVDLSDLLWASKDSNAVSKSTRSWAYSEICFMRSGTTKKNKVCPVFWVSDIGCAFAYFDLSQWPNKVYKLVQNEPLQDLELYDILDDPYETKDLASSKTNKVTTLLAERNSIRTPYCDVESDYDTDCYPDPCMINDKKKTCQQDANCTWSNKECLTANCTDLSRRHSDCKSRSDCYWQPWQRLNSDRCIEDQGSTEANYEYGCSDERASARACKRNKVCEYNSGSCSLKTCAELSYKKGICKGRADCSWNANAAQKSARCQDAS